MNAPANFPRAAIRSELAKFRVADAKLRIADRTLATLRHTDPEHARWSDKSAQFEADKESARTAILAQIEQATGYPIETISEVINND